MSGCDHEHRYEGRGRDDVGSWDCACGDTMAAALERAGARSVTRRTTSCGQRLLSDVDGQPEVSSVGSGLQRGPLGSGHTHGDGSARVVGARSAGTALLGLGHRARIGDTETIDKGEFPYHANLMTTETHTHPGPCYVGLGMWVVPFAHSVRELVERAVQWAPEDEFEDVLPLVHDVLAKIVPVGTYAVEVTAQQRDAVEELVREACGYWTLCGYADEDDDDAWLGTYENGAGIAECFLYGGAR